MSNKNKITLIISIAVLIFVVVISFIVINPRAVSVFSNNIDIFEKIEFDEANLNKYTIYGTHLNLSLSVNNEEKIDDIVQSKIIFRNSDRQDLEYNLDYEVEDEIVSFNTSSNINTGIDLENINIEDYYVVLKITVKDFDKDGNEILKDYYYNIVNKTEYDKLEYYTITREDSNKKISISFEQIPNKDISSLHINVEATILTEDIYDVVIDAGHGGSDVGASGNSYTEAEVTLKYALMVKEKLENLGLKVKLTRDENETRLPTYGEGGRYVIANEVKAKFLLSIHLNSSESSSVRGVEIYSPNNSDLTFSKNLAKSFVEEIGATYSLNRVWKIEDGVYVRNFSDEEIQESKEYAIEYGFEPYNITNNTSYYGIIRETGGICTGAYVDGRNKNYGDNPYYNSNIGVESYLLEIGYITNKDELNNILTNIESYTDLIVRNTKEYLNL